MSISLDGARPLLGEYLAMKAWVWPGTAAATLTRQNLPRFSKVAMGQTLSHQISATGTVPKLSQVSPKVTIQKKQRSR